MSPIIHSGFKEGKGRVMNKLKQWLMVSCIGLSALLPHTSIASQPPGMSAPDQIRLAANSYDQPRERGGFFRSIRNAFSTDQLRSRQSQSRQGYQRQRQHREYQQQRQRQHREYQQQRPRSRAIYQERRRHQAQPRPAHRSIIPEGKTRYSDKLCASNQYKCHTVKRGESWEKLFPDEQQRDMVRRLNRLNLKLWAGLNIAVPKNLEEATLFDISPFDKKVDTKGKKLILVSLPKLAWVAYDERGEQVKWGPASGGLDFCADIGKPCNTIRGIFAVFNKKDRYCKSGSYPVDRGGGAPMPYCMYFHSGFAIHGSKELPGYNASHGCVRVYTEDAKWLNEEFVSLPMFEHDKGTEVIVQTAEAPSLEALNSEEVIQDITENDDSGYEDNYYETSLDSYDARSNSENSYERQYYQDRQQRDRQPNEYRYERRPSYYQENQYRGY